MTEQRITILLVLILATTASAVASTVMSVDTVVAGSSQVVSININVTNASPFVGVQFDLLFPSTLSYHSGSARLTSRANGHSLAASLVSPGRVRVLAYSTELKAFAGSAGSVVVLDFTTSTQPGNYPLQLDNPLVADSDQRNILTSFFNGQFTLVAPNVEATPLSINFGDVPLFDRRTVRIEIRNTGNSALHITGVSSNRTEFSAEDSGAVTIVPGGVVHRNIRFLSERKGTITGTIRITSDDPDTPTLSISLTAKAFAVNELRMGSASARSGYTTTVSVSINNMEPFVGFQFETPLPSVARYVGASVALTSRTVDHVVVADTTGNVLRIIAYSPTNKPFSGSEGDIVRFTLLIRGDGGNYQLPITSGIISDSSATDIISASYPGNLHIVSPFLQFNQSTIDFGRVSARDTATAQLLIANQGSDTLVISSFQINNPKFMHNLGLPLTLLPAQSRSLTLSFHSPIEGDHSARITVRSNDFARDPSYVDLIASVFSPNVLRARSARAFLGEPSMIEIELENMKPIVALQFDISAPPQIQVRSDSIRLTTRKQDHTISRRQISAGVWRILSFSPTLAPFSGESGTVVEIPILVGDSSGTFPIGLANVLLSDTSGTDVTSGFEGAEIRVRSRKVSIPANYVEGWNLVSSPVVPDDKSVGALFPGAASMAFKFDGRYVVSDSIQQRFGYWLKFPGSPSFILSGLPVLSDTFALAEGWNLIGSISDTVLVEALLQIPNDVVSTLFFGFRHGYRIANSITPADAYWVKARTNGQLILHSNKDIFDFPSASGSLQAGYNRSTNLDQLGSKSEHSGDPFLDSLNALTVTDAQSYFQTLYFARMTADTAFLQRYELPPKPPADAFDVRFASNRLVTVVPESATDSVPLAIDIQTSRYPLRFSWDIKRGDAVYWLLDPDVPPRFPSTRLEGKGEFVVSDTGLKKVVLRVSHLPVSVPGKGNPYPDEFYLSQNYPNPFNSSTLVIAKVPSRGHIEIIVYDLYGRMIQKLMDKTLDAGEYSIRFDGQGLPSGLYFLRLKGEGFGSVRKMLLIR